MPRLIFYPAKSFSLPEIVIPHAPAYQPSSCRLGHTQSLTFKFGDRRSFCCRELSLRARRADGHSTASQMGIKVRDGCFDEDERSGDKSLA